MRLEESIVVLDAKVPLLTRIALAFNLPIIIALVGVLVRLLWLQ